MNDLSYVAFPERTGQGRELPERVRRWFQARHVMTFHAYSRNRRLGHALGHMKKGGTMTDAALDNGFDSLSGFADAVKRWTGDAPGASRNAPVVHLCRITTPIGPMLVGGSETGVRLVEFTDRRMLETQLKRIRRAYGCVFVPEGNAWTEHVKGQLNAYFAGIRTGFDLPLEMAGTPFQESVWKALLEIPYGSTVSYGDLAKTIGNSNAVRAVARANGDNRMAIVIPCHRVIGSDGSLTGYGGGLWRKQRLLELESGSTTLELFS